MDTIHKFNSEVLNGLYEQFIAIDSPNDPRGIDVACPSKYPILGIMTHVFDSLENYRRVFSRDCLEVSVEIAGSRPLHVLCNHFKSQRGRSNKEEDEAAARRLAQSDKVVDILQGTYKLDEELVAVMGDMNEDSTNKYHSLQPLFNCSNLVPVVDPNAAITERYSYFYAGGKKNERLSQLDYIFVSKALHEKLLSFGFVRNGIFGIDKAAKEAGAEPVEVYETVTYWPLSASDHAALWAEFNL